MPWRHVGGGEWSASRPCSFILKWKSSQQPLDKRLDGPQSRSERFRESNLGRAARSQSLYQLSYPDPLEIKVIINNEGNDKIKRRINFDNACYSGRKHIIPSSLKKNCRWEGLCCVLRRNYMSIESQLSFCHSHNTKRGVHGTHGMVLKGRIEHFMAFSKEIMKLSRWRCL
jgi:hypothetical protein